MKNQKTIYQIVSFVLVFILFVLFALALLFTYQYLDQKTLTKTELTNEQNFVKTSKQPIAFKDDLNRFFVVYFNKEFSSVTARNEFITKEYHRFLSLDDLTGQDKDVLAKFITVLHRVVIKIGNQQVDFLEEDQALTEIYNFIK